MDEGPATFNFLVALCVLGLLYPYFVLCHVAIIRSRGKRVRELAQEGEIGARYARLVLTKANSYLVSVQIGLYLFALVAGALIVNLWPATAGRFGLSFLGVAEILVMLVVSLTLGQAAKGIAFASPERVLCRLALPIMFFGRFVSPITFVLESAVGTALTRIGVRVPVERELVVSAEELSEMVELSSEAGEIEEDEREMIQGVFEFSDTVVREVMTPRKDIISVEESATLEQITQLFVQERLSRILVTGATLDDVRGILLAKDFMGLVGQVSPKFDIKRFMRPAYFVSDSKKVDALLEEFKRDAVHFAVVLDEHGGVDGVITVEDLIEEIVGEIFDEHDSPAEEVTVTKTKSGDLIVDGSIGIEDLNDNHNLTIPVGEYDTIAGFLIHQFGRIPTQGEAQDFEDLKLYVEELAQNRITKIRIQLPKKGSHLAALAKESFEPSGSSNESNHKGPENIKRASVSGAR
ncbi:MAG: HlyC/CorC family transporter [Deltaproteobacteria bacterium]|nr:HlyC/CorC family transporter [Deltaproteobacteria bacterium]